MVVAVGVTLVADAAAAMIGVIWRRGAAANPSPGGLETMRVALDCGVPLDTFGAQPGSTYGDNPALDALYDECAEGHGTSCDALYRQSGVRTEYEAFGFTCENRFEPADSPLSCESSI